MSLNAALGVFLVAPGEGSTSLKLSASVLGLVAWPALAATQVYRVEATPQQLVIRVLTDQTGTCTYRISEGQTFAAPVNDANEALFPGSTSDARPGSIAAGPLHVFVAGTRRAQRAADNRWHSRSLQADTPHFVGVKCGSDAEVTGVYRTANIPLGNTWTEPYPYDAEAPLGYAWPTVDFVDKSKAYVDPLTGVLIKRLTGLDEPADGSAPAAPTLPAAAAFAVTSGDWLTPENAARADNQLAVSTWNTPLFVAFSPVATSYSAGRPASWDVNVAGASITGVKVRITGSGTGGSNNAAICLTVSGVACATERRLVTFPSRIGTVDYPPDSIVAYFSDWLGPTLRQPPATYDMATRTGAVNVAGTSVTLASGNAFNVEAWTAGSHILIGSANGCTPGDYVIASVVSDRSLTLASSPGDCSGAAYTGYNFGLLVYPQESAILSIDAVTFTWDERIMYVNPQGGSSDYCNSTKVVDDAGESGWICHFPNTFGSLAAYFVPANLDRAGAAARLVFSAYVPRNPDRSINYETFAQDQTAPSSLNSYTSSIPSDASDPNSVYALVQDPSFAKWSILKGTYNPSGVGGSCTDARGYRAYTRASPTAQNCNVTWTNKTRASQGGTLTDRMAAFDSRFDPNYFKNLKLIGVRNGILLVGAITWQNLLAWQAFVETSNFTVVSMWSSYLEFPVRWSGVHAFGDLGDAQHTGFVTQNLNSFPCALDGCGPYQVGVTAVAGVPGAGLSETRVDSCQGVSDPRVVDLLPRGSGCIVLTLQGEPCDPDPSEYERANFPACSWNSSYRNLKGQQIQVGDTFVDPAAGEGAQGGEQFLVVRNTGENQWMFLRNFALARGPLLNDPPLSRLREHAPSFTLRATAGLSAKDCGYYGNFITDRQGTALQCDNAYYPTSHGDLHGTLAAVAWYYAQPNEFGYSVRSMAGPLSNQIGRPQTVNPSGPSVRAGTRFGNTAGAGFNVATVMDSHLSARQPAAPESEKAWILDMVRIGSFTAPMYTGARATNISGSLYQLSGFPRSAALNVKYRPLRIWSGRHNLQDVSGPNSTIGGGRVDNWKYCYAVLAGECVPESAAGDLYLNVPGARADGTCAAWATANTLCATPAAPELDTVTQIGFQRPAANGETSRVITIPFRPWFMTNIFANVHAMPDGSGAVFTCDWCNGVRTDLYWAKLPPTPPADGVDRANYVPAPVVVSGAPGDQVRIRFGYAENGPPEALFCTTRRESCATDASGAQPFVWLSEPQRFTPCNTECTVNIPAVPGRVVYFVVEKLNGEVLSVSPLQALAVN